MRWYFTCYDLACDNPPGIAKLFKLMKHLLEYDPVREIWIMKRK